ncbi:MAG: HD domain-containing protein [Muribaculaceae bacterium]|nr:HD domain-containing protein [Muribaculaceae bacterium]
MDYNAIITHFYTPGYPDHDILVTHSRQVAQLAVTLATHYNVQHPEQQPIDTTFVEEAAMLHDIAVFRTYAPGIGCYGDQPYIKHGILGRELLEQLCLPRHALVCERHTGAGISTDDIVHQHLDLPLRDMLPISLEEKVICYADKFYSKSHISRMKTIDKTRQSLAKFGPGTTQRFEELVQLFGFPSSLPPLPLAR